SATFSKTNVMAYCSSLGKGLPQVQVVSCAGFVSKTCAPRRLLSRLLRAARKWLSRHQRTSRGERKPSLWHAPTTGNGGASQRMSSGCNVSAMKHVPSTKRGVRRTTCGRSSYTGSYPRCCYGPVPAFASPSVLPLHSGKCHAECHLAASLRGPS